jgi:ATP-dependent Zn protease
MKDLNPFYKKILAQYCGANENLHQVLCTNDKTLTQQAFALPLLHACKFMPKSVANEFIFIKKGIAVFGFDFDFKKAIEFEKEEFLKALDKASKEIAPTVLELSASDFINNVQMAINELPQTNDAFYASTGMASILNKLSKAPGVSQWVITSFSNENDVLVDLDDNYFEDIEPNWATSFIEDPLPEKMTSKAFISNEKSCIKDLVKQCCWVACAESINAGVLTATLNSTTYSQKDRWTQKNLVALTPSLLLTSIFGSSLMLEYLANVFELNKCEIKFPERIYNQRNDLMEHMVTKTFESVENGQRKETHWVAKAEECKASLALDKQCTYFLGALFSDNSFCSLHERIEYLSSRSNWQYIGDVLGQFIQMNVANKASRIQKLSTIKSINNTLNNQVLGQPHAVDTVCSAVSSMLLKKTKVHLGVSTFLGTSGVGKTFLAEKLADTLNEKMNLGFKCTVINMEQYTDEKDVLKLFGSGSQYVSAEYGELTTAVVKYPRHVFVFDEAEKGHSVALQSLLTLIEKGRTKDRTTEREVDFSSCHFIFTTNLGSEIIEQLDDLDVEINLNDLLSNTRSKNALSNEMVNRLASGSLALFKKLSARDFIHLAVSVDDGSLGGGAFDWKNNIPELILNTLGGDVTARNIRTQAEKLETAVESRAINLLPEASLSKLENITVTQVRESIDNEYNIILFSNNKLLCEHVSTMGIACESADNIENISKVIEQEADGYIFDEKAITIPTEALITLLENNAKGVYFTISGKNSTDFDKLSAWAKVIHRRFTIDVRTKRKINELIDITKREVHLIKKVGERVKRNMKASYSISVQETDDGINAEFKDFSYKCTLSQDDLSLPFLNFEGAPDVNFDDVYGLESAKKDFGLVINAMSDDKYFKARNTSIPKGYILSGHPGTGKTMLAKALAAECGLSFFNVNSADLIDGNIVENINTLFDVVEKNAPAILFLDEIDAIAQSRNKGSDLTRIAVNTLLVRLDGFKRTELPVFVLAATNYPSLLDRALMRSGRLEKNIYCDLPSADVRKSYVQQHLESSNCQISEDKLSEITKVTAGATIAVLAQIIRESFYTEIKTETPWHVDMLIEEIRTAKFGGLRDDISQAQEDIKATAYHEAGHLVAHKLLFPKVKVEFASVQPRGAALGMIVPGENSSTGSVNKRSIKNHLQVLLAGLATERLQGFVGDNSLSGASDDRLKATNLAKRAITDWGMSEQFDLAIPSQLTITPSDITTEVNSWLSEAFDAVTGLLKENTKLLTVVAETLIKQETLNSSEIDELFTEYTLKSELKLVS